ncbi:MAG: hypothetical protein RDU24_07435 [Humidesulfovibrio sp.]|uniref:hypothetical protein n=1 Tax=Humidesulfovibrio sp. TaxID=2910988 RepID=UPI0027F4445E|nr:hypothetical protein [Humidesulfovibrio sp.]MDQ7835200.1 hypothetical protein [Humidesulfovibrio sp.]
MDAHKELDILEMPVEALAAYWLSIKKLLDTKKDLSLLAIEAENTSEPFVRHLLDTAQAGFSPELALTLAKAKRGVLLTEFRRRMEMMRRALTGLAASENPRLTLLGLNALVSTSPFHEPRTFELATALMTTVAQKDADLPTLLGVDHKLKDDRLVVKLLFYAISTRRSGKQALNDFLPHLRAGFFAEGLSLCADGFEAEFVSQHLASIRDAALLATRRKMDMATQLCLAIKAGLSYDDVFRVARAYML